MPQIDNTNIKEFTRLYHATLINGAKQFKFEGRDVLVAWAKHVIEYFANKGYGEPDKDEIVE